MTDIRVPPSAPISTPMLDGNNVYVGEIWRTWFDLVVQCLSDLEEEVEVVENHFHNTEKWFGIASPQTATDWGTVSTLTPYTATSGNNTYGTDANDEALVLGSADTPTLVGKTKFDLHEMFVVATSSSTVYKLRILYGTGTMAEALAADQYSTTVVRLDAANPAQSEGTPFSIMMPRLDAGTRVWVQAWNATDNATITFLVGLHEYDS